MPTSENYTRDDLWADFQAYCAWLQLKPKWWQFRKRRAWKKAGPEFGYAPILSVTVKPVDFDQFNRVESHTVKEDSDG